jgi:hypothetical protein
VLAAWFFLSAEDELTWLVRHWVCGLTYEEIADRDHSGIRRGLTH